MTRLLVHVEGQTEETFVNESLAPHLWKSGYNLVSARIVGNARLRQQRGGVKPWPSVQREIVRHLKEDPNCIATTMVDYYGLLQSEGGGWPGRGDANKVPFDLKSAVVEKAMLEDIVASMGESFDQERFRPYVVMHEFEGLLFSDCGILSKSIGKDSLEGKLSEIREQFATPEEINDSVTTAPSKRLLALIPEYTKPLHGNVAALSLGIDKIRDECPKFNAWLADLEAAGG